MNLVNQVKKNLDRNSFLFNALRAIYTFLRVVYQGGLSLVFRLFPIKGNKIVINNHHGQGYGDNAKYIVEELLKSNIDYDIVWLLKGKTKEEAGLPEKIRAVRFGSVKNIYEMTTARLWIENNRIYQYLFKRKGQFYLQTWHGGLGLKKIEGDASYGASKRYIKYARRDSAMTDLYISNSKHLTDIYRRAFWYKGKVLEEGYPKNDILFSEKEVFRSKLRKTYSLSSQCRILLYAPTFRDDSELSAYDVEFDTLIDNLSRREGEEWEVMVRLHPKLNVPNFHEVFGSEIVDASCFPDMQELVLGVDILVTDYSSCMFDSAIAKIPTFIYASDVTRYVDERGFYFALRELPFPIAVNTLELVNNISGFNFSCYFKQLEGFYKKVGLYDQGKASDITAMKIKKILSENSSDIGKCQKW